MGTVMARMRFSTDRPHARYADDRQPEHLGDVPPAPPEPKTRRWSITTWPKPLDDEEVDSDD